MTEKTTEEIDKEIEEVKNRFNSVEEVIGQLASESGRNHLVHRELRSFTWFVGMMIFSKISEELDDEFVSNFKKTYDNFRLGEGSNADDLFKWACLYWIYNKEWEKTDEYKEVSEII